MELPIDHRLFLLFSAPFVGSFPGVVIERYPTGRPLLMGRSVCSHCEHALSAADLVPLVSWLVSGVRCRYCRRRIPSFYPAIEIAALLIAMWSLAVLPGWIAWAGCGLRNTRFFQLLKQLGIYGHANRCLSTLQQIRAPPRNDQRDVGGRPDLRGRSTP